MEKPLLSKQNGLHNGGHFALRKFLLLYFEQNNCKREQRQRLNKRKAQHEEQEDSRACAWVSGHRFAGGSNGAALSKTAKTGGNGHRNTGGNRHHAGMGVRGPGGLRESRNGHAQNRERHKSFLHRTHIFSPNSFLRIPRQWVVDAHRAGALTLYRGGAAGAEANSSKTWKTNEKSSFFSARARLPVRCRSTRAT